MDIEKINKIRASTGNAPLPASYKPGTPAAAPAQTFADKYGWNKTQVQIEPPTLTEKLGGRVSDFTNAISQAKTHQINPLSAGIQQTGAIAGGVNDIAGSAVKTAVGAVHDFTPAGFLYDKILKPAFSAIGDAVGSTGAGQAIKKSVQDTINDGSGMWNQFSQAHPEIAKDLQSVGNIGMAVPTVLGAGEGLGTVADAIGETAAGKTVSAIAKTGADAAKGAAEFVGAIPERAAINTASKQAEKNIVSALPQEAQKAAENGILPRDLQLFQNASPQEKNIAQKMVEDAKNYSVDRTAVNPALHVGKEFRKPIQALEDLKDTAGEQLGEYTKGIDSSKVSGVKNAVVKRLQEVPGLKGIKMNPINAEEPLDFSRTSLAGPDSATARKSIVDNFNHLTGKDAEQLHLHRQELFEVLGGKKSSLTNMTEAEDNALQAIRQGEADVLDKANPQYKKLNQKYAEVTDALKNVRKYFKGTSDTASGDVLDLKASQLARRLTSNASSNSDLRGVLEKVKSVLEKNGVDISAHADIPKLQEMHNALNRYYDIAPDTGLAGQVKLGTQKIPTSIGELAGKLGEGVKNTIGKSDAVRQKAFEDFIKQLNISE